MVETERPQYYENTLTPLPINPATLIETLRELREAVYNGAELVHTNEPIPDKWSAGGMFKHFPGVALAFLRLDYQSSVLANQKATSSEFRQYALQRIPSGLPDMPLLPSRLSPAGSLSPMTAVTLHILSAVAESNWGSEAKPSLTPENITCLHDAVNLALNNEAIVPHGEHRMGGDEMLYGRAGLLWLLLNVRAHRFNDKTEAALASVLDMVPQLVRVIVEAGREGSKDYVQKHGKKEAHPLMYAWMEGHYGFGAAHGITGILPILLSCNDEEISEYMPEIGETITALCKLCTESNGHLPMTLPPRGPKKPSELVQFCHGSPGILLLLGTALQNDRLTRAYWHPTWDQTLYQATCRTWEEGILSKGGSLCHGISGNAWPWLLLHDAFEYHSRSINDARRGYFQRTQDSSQPDDNLSQKLTSDFFLSRALAFMLHAFETRPYNTAPGTSGRDYRTPDDPYSLFEGLAGNVCAWAESCAVIQARLRKTMLSEEGVSVEDDSMFQQAMRCRLGFPLIGGNGVRGVL
ncbi:uncharacterized protein N7473_000750 [Penicillium subrubescens]|uniref:LanC-like protein 1 n=1 Tax=Penicillium subrubescens TaxID=1316194 RepID=A0A1Q5T0L8_9EURO|nr:uncharacterized protein N7473_000750 [Penicillium subrubescens]KAJ5911447.1 hypothetical protein N7473_000750 [Penicillium subrubescens]OKO93821.1 LanC-like protein 1 [Penicillium subrubescens]